MFEIGDVVQYCGSRRLVRSDKGLKAVERGQIGAIEGKAFRGQHWRGEWNVCFFGISGIHIIPQSELNIVSSKDCQKNRGDFFLIDDDDDLSREEMLREEFGVDEDYVHTVRRRKPKFDDEQGKSHYDEIKESQLSKRGGEDE